MQIRVARDAEDSDIAQFYALLFLGELVVKLVTLSIVAAIQDDRDRKRYRLLYRLVRADGLGDWPKTLDEAVLGPPSQHFVPSARHEQNQLTTKVREDAWQHKAVHLLQRCFEVLEIECESPPVKIQGRQWFANFAQLRNKTRGHGAPTGSQCRGACEALSASLDLLVQGFDGFKRPWAYLHRNLSGKYRVVMLGGDDTPFEFLKGDKTVRLQDGIYVAYDGLVRIPLIETDVDLADFYLANGDFRGTQCEGLSYNSGDTRRIDASSYLTPVERLPASETAGTGVLMPTANCFSNIPPLPARYVPRPGPESELEKQLTLESHPIISLTGPGGIGKTSLALQVLHRMSRMATPRYAAVVWFSARDIDLQMEGPKRVQPDVLALPEICTEFVRLLAPADADTSKFDKRQYLGDGLSKGTIGPTLFVFDNFETVANPLDVFIFLDTFVRAPNKVLITTRSREFNGDYSLEVAGMTHDEADELVDTVAGPLGIKDLLTQNYRAELYQETDGHPYLIKINLGEVATLRSLVKPARILATQDEILIALFERTFASLSPAAQRIFLMLCNWRSVVPEFAVVIAVLRKENEKIDPEAALTELRRASFIDDLKSDADTQVFVNVPAAAMVFGKAKLLASPLKAAVEADTLVLRRFGAAARDDVRHGVLPRIRRFLQSAAAEILNGRERLDDHEASLELIGRRVPTAWIDIARFYGECDVDQTQGRTKRALRRYLESDAEPAGRNMAWGLLVDACRQTGDVVGEVHALVERCQLKNASIDDLSRTANRLNTIHQDLKRRGESVFDTEEKRILIAPVAAALAARFAELTAVDLSRLAWLQLHLDADKEALRSARQGNRIDPADEHCRRLLDKLEQNPRLR